MEDITVNEVDFRRMMREFKQLNSALRALAKQAWAGVPYNVLQPKVVEITSRFDAVRRALDGEPVDRQPEPIIAETWTFTVHYPDADDAGLPSAPGEEL